MSVEYGSEEYYEQTGKNGLTINTKKTENLPAYDKKLYYLGDFFKRMLYTTVTRPSRNNLVTYSNFYYKDETGKIYVWHRKRKSRYAFMPGGSIIYIDAEAAMERFTGSYSPSEPWKRAPVFHGMLNGKAYFTVIGSSKNGDEDNVYIAVSDDGTLIEPILKIPETYDGFKDTAWYYRFYNWFRQNNKGKFGHFVIQRWRKDDDPNPSYNMRNKIFCNIYDGVNYHSDIVAQDMYGDGDIEETYGGTSAIGELHENSDYYPIFVYHYVIERYSVSSSSRYDPTRNLHNFCDMFSSQYVLYIAYYWYRVYNANTNQTTDFPFVTYLDKVNTLWYSSDGGGYYYYKIIDPKTIPINFARCLGVMPYFDNLGVCPNGNVLVSVFYHVDPRIPDYIREEYPEWVYFRRFALTPIYYVIDYSSGKWIKSNIQEPDDYDTSKSQSSGASVNSNMRPKGVYTDSEFLWFRKQYREETDITFYGTRDGYNIDKRITYYNRKTIQGTFHMMTKNQNKELTITTTIGQDGGGIGGVHYTGFNPVPVFENGVFQKYMLCVSVYSASYEETYLGLVNDLKPDNYGILQIPLVAYPRDNQRYDGYRIRYTKKQPDQLDDDYIFEIE